MSNAGASLLLVAVLIVLAVYFVLVPPLGYEESWGHRLAIPFILVICAFGILENLRTRAHIAQLVGALRSLAGRSGAEASPEVKGEAIQILMHSLGSEQESVRRTAAAQLENLTGERFGQDADAWARWWKANRERYGK